MTGVPTINISRPTPPFTTTAPIANAVIIYNIVVVDNFHSLEFNFNHRPPPDLQRDVSNRAALLAFMNQLVHEHHRELLAAHPWKCIECGLPATALVHRPISLLHYDVNPHKRDTPASVCYEGTPCWINSLRTREFMMNHLFASPIGAFTPDMSETWKRCGYCAKADIHDGDTWKNCSKCKKVSDIVRGSVRLRIGPITKKCVRIIVASHNCHHTDA